MHEPVKNFLLILGAALGSALLGGLFALALAALSPELIIALFGPYTEIMRLAVAAGLIAGLVIGAGVMAVALLVVALVRRR